MTLLADSTPAHYSRPVHGSVIYYGRFYLLALWHARRGRTLLVGRPGRWQVRQMEDR